MLPNLPIFFDAFQRVLEIHVKTKTKDIVFHDFTKSVYEKLFDVFHNIAEKGEDIKKGLPAEDVQAMKNETYELVEHVKELVDGMKDKHSTGMDDLIRGLVNDLETLCGTARGFTVEKEEAMEGAEHEETPYVADKED